MKRMHLATAMTLVSLAAVAGPPAAPSQSNTFTVDCNRGQKISAALQLGDFRKPLVVNVRGTCSESVVIIRDNVTLRGDPGGTTTIVAPDSASDVINIGADGVTLEYLTLTSGGFGIRVSAAFRSTVSHCVIHGTSSDGIRLFAGDVRIDNSTIRNTGASGVNVQRGGSVTLTDSQVIDNPGIGVNATGNATIAATRAVISGNGSYGVQLESGSYGSFRGGEISGNGADASKPGSGLYLTMSQGRVSGGVKISNNRDGGLLAVAGAMAGIDGNTITDNGGSGVGGYLGALLVLHGNTISRNDMGIWCTVHCTLQIGGATITDNIGTGITLAQASKLLLEELTTDATNNGGDGLWCEDGESSVIGTEWLNGTISPTCTGYD